MKTGFIVLLLVIAATVGCSGINDAVDATKSMPGYLSNMTTDTAAMEAQGNATAEDLRLQKLNTGIQDMLDSNNTVYLTPAPFDMFAGAQIAADVITPDELVKLAFVEMMAINKQTPDPSQMVPGPTPGSLVWPTALVTSVDHDKMVKLDEIALIGGLASEDTINSVIANQITGHGAYETWAYNLLMCRFLALQSYLINESILNVLNPLTNLGQLDLAVTRTEYLQHMTQLPFVSKISISVIGMLSPNDNFSMSVDMTAVPTLRAELLRRAQTDLASFSSDPAYAPLIARINAL